MSSPANKSRLSASRTSITGRTSLQGGQSSLPRPTSITSRLATTQPTYDFISGGPADEGAPPTKRTALRQPIVHRQDSSHDEGLRAKINALEYELKNIQQERSLLVLQHEKELRDLQLRADADFKKYQTAESASKKATQRCDQLANELRDAQDQAINEKASLERRLRDVQDQNGSLQEDVQDAQAQLSDQERHFQHQIHDVEAKRVALQETVDQIRSDFDSLSQNLDASRARLTQRDAEVESYKAQVEELQLHSHDSHELSVVQRELTDQVEHIRRVESTNREQLAELRRLRDAHRTVQVVEEQKRALETELHVLQDVHRQLGEAQIQKEILEDEKRTWSTLLEREGHEKEFDSPEAVVRALVHERIEHASLIDRLGHVEAELSEKDEVIKTLEAGTATLTEELAKAKRASTAGGGEAGSDSKAYKRLDRQRMLVVKEVEYLRAQLKTFDAEETVLMDNPNYDAQRLQQVQQLEALVDQYKAELQSLHAELSAHESATAQSTPAEPRGTKRPAASQDPDSDTTSQLGHLLRKNKNLQVALQKSAQQAQLLATDLQATKSQLKSLRASTKSRILSLRDNPTATAEKIKQSTLTTLKAENTHLLAQLRGSSLDGVKVVPISTLDALQLELADLQRSLVDQDKRMRRQREIWTDKAAEFRESIASVLGWRVVFLPNGKVKVASIYHGPPRDDEAEEEEGDIEKNFIMFDGDHGTMKISGGDGGAFEREVGELVAFWIREKREIPCLLAAMTLEFYDRYRSKGDTTQSV